MDSKIIVISTGKGGAGKTTTSTNLTATFAIQNPDKKICLIDLDKQAGVSTTFGRTREKYEGYSIFSLIAGQKNLNQILFNDFYNESKEHISNFWFIPAEKTLSEFNEQLVLHPELGSNFIATMKHLKQKFDYIFIDTHPDDDSKLNLLAYYCSDLIVVPVEMEMQNKISIDDILGSVRNLQYCSNSKFYILPNKVKINTKLHQQFLEIIANQNSQQQQLFPNTTFLSTYTIPNTTQFSASVARKHLPLVLTKSKAKTALVLKELFEKISLEILEILDNKAL